MPDSISRRVFTRPDYGTVTITGNLPDGFVGEVVNYAYTITGGYGTKTAAVASGSLPGGLSVSSAGVVTGTRTTAESSSWTMTATDQDSVVSAPLADASVTALPPSMSGAAPDGEFLAAYSHQYTVSNAVGATTVTVTAGAVPDGTTIDNDALLSGTPSEVVTANPTYRITDSRGYFSDFTDSFDIAYDAVFNSDPAEYSATTDGTGGVAEFQDDDFAIYALFGTGGATESRIRVQSVSPISGKRYYEFDLAMNNDTAAGRFYCGIHADSQGPWPAAPSWYVILRAQNADGTGTIAVDSGGTTATTAALNWSTAGDHGTCRFRMAVDVPNRLVWIGVGASGTWENGDPDLGTGGDTPSGANDFYLYGDLLNTTSAKERRIEIVLPTAWTWAPPAGFA